MGLMWPNDPDKQARVDREREASEKLKSALRDLGSSYHILEAPQRAFDAIEEYIDAKLDRFQDLEDHEKRP